MNRIFAFVAALTLTAVTVSSSCLAGTADSLHVSVQPAHRAGEVQLWLYSAAKRSTPEHIAELRRAGINLPSADEMVKLRAIGFDPVRDRG